MDKNNTKWIMHTMVKTDGKKPDCDNGHGCVDCIIRRLRYLTDDSERFYDYEYGSKCSFVDWLYAEFTSGKSIATILTGLEAITIAHTLRQYICRPYFMRTLIVVDIDYQCGKDTIERLGGFFDRIIYIYNESKVGSFESQFENIKAYPYVRDDDDRLWDVIAQVTEKEEIGYVHTCMNNQLLKDFICNEVIDEVSTTIVPEIGLDESKYSAYTKPSMKEDECSPISMNLELTDLCRLGGSYIRCLYKNKK